MVKIVYFMYVNFIANKVALYLDKNGGALH